jgi:hypothetical protein
MNRRNFFKTVGGVAGVAAIAPSVSAGETPQLTRPKAKPAIPEGVPLPGMDILGFVLPHITFRTQIPRRIKDGFPPSDPPIPLRLLFHSETILCFPAFASREPHFVKIKERERATALLKQIQTAPFYDMIDLEKVVGHRIWTRVPGWRQS